MAAREVGKGREVHAKERSGAREGGGRWAKEIAAAAAAGFLWQQRRRRRLRGGASKRRCRILPNAIDQ